MNEIKSKDEWFLAVGEAHEDFHIVNGAHCTKAEIFLGNGKTKCVGRWYNLDNYGVVDNGGEHISQSAP
jgi:hypothetical protein